MCVCVWINNSSWLGQWPAKFAASMQVQARTTWRLCIYIYSTYTYNAIRRQRFANPSCELYHAGIILLPLMHLNDMCRNVSELDICEPCPCDIRPHTRWSIIICWPPSASRANTAAGHYIEPIRRIALAVAFINGLDNMCAKRTQARSHIYIDRISYSV